MKTTITINVSHTNGIIDEAAAQEALSQQLRTLKEERAAEGGKVASAVASVFDRYPGARPNLPDLVGMAVGSLSVDPPTYARLVRLCLEYVRANCQGNKVGDSVERPNSLYVMSKGHEGGVCRRADLKAVEKVAA